MLEERFRLLYKITSQSSLSNTKQLEKALKLCCELLDLDIGIISRINGDTYSIKHYYPKDSDLKEGQAFELGDTYCSITKEADDVISIDHMERSKHRRHPCYQVFRLESYIGVPIEIDNQLYGTLNFSSPEPKKPEFKRADERFIMLLGEWVADIIKQEQIEEELNKERELYRLISENAADLISLHAPDGTYEYVSPSVKQILGYEPKELIGKDPYELFHPEDLERIQQESHEKAVEGDRVRSIQYRMRKKNGRYIWLETSTEPIKNEQGEVVKLRTGSRDITERKLLELLLRETGSLASVGGWQFDLRTEQLVFTDEVYKIHDLPVGEDMPLNKALDFYPDEARQKIEKLLERAIETGEGYDVELPFVSAKGNEKWVRAIAKTHEDEDGNVHRLTGVFQDLTEKKHVESQLKARNKELERLNETTSKIYSVIGHDLRSPINAITGFSGLLMNDLENVDDTGAAQQKLEYIYNSAHKVAQLLEDLLHWARLQTGGLQLNIEEFSLPKVIDDTIDLLSVTAKNKSLSISYDDNLSSPVTGDKRMINTIFRNLLSNAVKYSEQGDTIHVRSWQDNQSWYLSVKDEGIGMTEEEMSSLFDGKTNKSKRGTASEKGTGIGLVLCNELVDMHGGSIEVASEPGQGSTFTVRIPFDTEQEH